MLHELRFSQGGVAKKDFLPELTHFHISGGRIMGYNGVLAASTPIPLDIECNPKAEQMVRAIMACTDEAATRLTLTPTGRLSIRSGKFKALVECLPDVERPPVNITGTRVELPAGFIALLRKLRPFIAEDASRNWAKGIMFRRGCLYVTNNLVMIQAWAGIEDWGNLPEFNIPEMTINELLRIKEAPTHANVSDKNLTFHYEGNKWLWTTLYDSTWPEMDALLDNCLITDRAFAVDAELSEALVTLKPFLAPDMRIVFRNGMIATHENDEQGAAIEYDVPQVDAAYSHRQLSLVAEIADKLDLSHYPKPSAFVSDGLRGLLAGMQRNAG